MVARPGNYDAALTFCADNGGSIEIGGESRKLGHPVVHERRGAHHQRGERAAGMDLFARNARRRHVVVRSNSHRTRRVLNRILTSHLTGRKFRRLRAPGVALVEEVRDHLQRFPQTHVICQNAAETSLAQRAQPLEAFGLMGAQHVMHAIGSREVRIGDGLEIADDSAKTFVAAEPNAARALQHGIDEQRAVCRHALDAFDQIRRFHAQAIGQIG